jgi:hypothetical protein
MKNLIYIFKAKGYTMNASAVRTAGLDKFYTVDSVAQNCINHLASKYAWSDWTLVVEPSAGSGSFLLKIPDGVPKVGLDIAPEHDSVVKQDFLTWAPAPGGKILIIGNPPFGKICSLAIKFFNHAAAFASVIAFIVPRTFRRISVQNKLNMNFCLVADMDIAEEPCAFSPPMAAKCCFQIWASGDLRVPEVLLTTHADWTFLPFGPLDASGQPTVPAGADFAIRAYGGKCGHVTTALTGLRPKSWHWIKVGAVSASTLIERFKKLDYALSKNTARQNSIGRGDLVKLYSAAFSS